MIVRVAYRAARAGIVTGVLLAVARISGETAPLLFTALNNQFWSINLNAPMASLPVVIFQFALTPYEDWQKLAWTGALLITVTVLALSIIARSAHREKVHERRHGHAVRRRAGRRARRRRHRGPRREGLDPQPRLLLRRQPRAEGHQPAALRQQGDRLHRPVGLRQVDAAARAQPHVRPLSRPARRPARCCSTARTSCAPAQDLNLLRARIGMVFQKPTPFPMSIYDNIAFGIRLYEKPAARRDGRAGRGGAAPRRAVGRGQGQARQPAASACRAASSSACASPAPSR